LYVDRLEDYLSQMGHLNQISSLAFQLKSDVDFLNHKYMAHQLALLYVNSSTHSGTANTDTIVSILLDKVTLVFSKNARKG
jgi:hypothetical protein